VKTKDVKNAGKAGKKLKTPYERAQKIAWRKQKAARRGSGNSFDD
jgi:hypothetical protein